MTFTGFKAHTDHEIVGDIADLRLDEAKEIFGRPHPIYYVTLAFPNSGMFQELEKAYADCTGWHASTDYSAWCSDRTYLRFESILEPQFGIDPDTGFKFRGDDLFKVGDLAKVSFRTELDWNSDRTVAYPVLQLRFVEQHDINAEWDSMPISECEQRLLDNNGGQTYDF